MMMRLRWLTPITFLVAATPLLQSQQCGQPIATYGPDYLSYWNLPPNGVGGNPQIQCVESTNPGTQVGYSAGSFSGSCSLPWIENDGTVQWFQSDDVGPGELPAGNGVCGYDSTYYPPVWSYATFNNECPSPPTSCNDSTVRGVAGTEQDSVADNSWQVCEGS